MDVATYHVIRGSPEITMGWVARAEGWVESTNSFVVAISDRAQRRLIQLAELHKTAALEELREILEHALRADGEDEALAAVQDIVEDELSRNPGSPSESEKDAIVAR